MHKRVQKFGWHKEGIWHKYTLLKTFFLLIIVIVIIQLLYPNDRMLPLVKIDGQFVGGQTRQQAITSLNHKYDELKLNIFMGTNLYPVSSPTLAQMGISIDNLDRVNNIKYPLWLRLLPTSLLWAETKSTAVPQPIFSSNFDQYLDKNLMGECKREPVNATIKTDKNKVIAVHAQNGGICQRDDVFASLHNLTPSLSEYQKVALKEINISPVIDYDKAKILADNINSRIINGVPLRVNNETIVLTPIDVLSWLSINIDNDNEIEVSISSNKAKDVLSKSLDSKIIYSPRSSYVQKANITNVIKNNTVKRVLDIDKTSENISKVINGQASFALVETRVPSATESFLSQYDSTNAGITTMITDYAKSHSGTYGISFIELGGKKRQASYNGDQKFTAASTYKLFVAYSLLRQIDNGDKDWNSVRDCFNKMISISDNRCAEKFLYDIGRTKISKEIQDIGLSKSGFVGTNSPQATANDLALLLQMLENGQGFSPTNRSRLLSAMKNNIYRYGIPTGVNDQVANKVGFLNNYTHDAAIVYSPKGTYVLVIMTKGSSWATIADLSDKIDLLRSKD